MIITRLWHYALLPYLPDAQFKGQFREAVAILRDWIDERLIVYTPLIKKITDYPESDLFNYFNLCIQEYNRRGMNLINPNKYREFINCVENSGVLKNKTPFDGWHNKDYLRVCMANLYEKWKFGKGKSRITDEEWQRLCDGYKKITGEEYVI